MICICAEERKSSAALSSRQLPQILEIFSPLKEGSVLRLSRHLTIFFFGISLLVLGCQEGKPRVSSLQTAVSPSPCLLSVYLETSGICGQNTSFVLSSMEILSDGLWLPLDLEKNEFKSSEVKDRQTFLGASALPEGNYKAVRFRIENSSGPSQKTTEKSEIVVPIAREFSLARSDSSCLFVEWMLRDCPSGQQSTPKLHVRLQEQPLSSDLLYVLCGASRTLYLVRADNYFVISSYGLPGRCGEMHVDSSNHRLYILNTQQRLIHVFDTGTSRFIDRISLNQLINPEHFALDTENSIAFVTDSDSSTVLSIDLKTGQVNSQQRSLIRPQRIIGFSDSGLLYLAVASPQTQSISILSATDLQKIREIRVGQKMDGILYHQGFLYAAETNSNQVSVFDAIAGQYQGRISVGLQPRYLSADAGGRIFVSNSGGNTLSVITPGQFVSARTLRVKEHPFVSAVSSQRQNLYVGYEDKGMVSILDVASERPLAEVHFAGAPFFLDILE